MKKIIPIVIAAALLSFRGNSQLYQTKIGFIGFYSKTPFEDIKAENNQVYAVIDAGKKNIAFSVLLKGFIFQKELMQEHFNTNYVESDKFPKAVFVGAYTGDAALKEGLNNVTVRGKLTLHNVTKDIDMPATLELKSGALSGKSTFKLKPEDFNITIPSVVREKIDKDISVTVRIDCIAK